MCLCVTLHWQSGDKVVPWFDYIGNHEFNILNNFARDSTKDHILCFGSTVLVAYARIASKVSSPWEVCYHFTNLPVNVQSSICLCIFRICRILNLPTGFFKIFFLMFYGQFSLRRLNESDTIASFSLCWTPFCELFSLYVSAWCGWTPSIAIPLDSLQYRKL